MPNPVCTVQCTTTIVYSTSQIHLPLKTHLNTSTSQRIHIPPDMLFKLISPLLPPHNPTAIHPAHLYHCLSPYSSVSILYSPRVGNSLFRFSLFGSRCSFKMSDGSKSLFTLRATGAIRSCQSLLKERQEQFAPVTLFVKRDGRECCL